MLAALAAAPEGVEADVIAVKICRSTLLFFVNCF
jgi:hypothetical protein